MLGIKIGSLKYFGAHQVYLQKRKGKLGNLGIAFILVVT
jgi:hypothetical protein